MPQALSLRLRLNERDDMQSDALVFETVQVRVVARRVGCITGPCWQALVVAGTKMADIDIESVKFANDTEVRGMRPWLWSSTQTLSGVRHRC